MSVLTSVCCCSVQHLVGGIISIFVFLGVAGASTRMVLLVDRLSPSRVLLWKAAMHALFSTLSCLLAGQQIHASALCLVSM
jgi:hypothetical protein